MDNRGWAVVFCLLMAVAVVLELLTPSMGAFTIVALGLSGASIYMGFRWSESFGYIMIASNMALFPLGLWIGLNFLKRSPIMHHHELTHGSQSSPDARPLAHLIGKHGRAITPLRPAGSAMIEDARFDVVAQGKFIEIDTPIKVIHVEGNRVVVEPAAQA